MCFLYAYLVERAMHKPLSPLLRDPLYLCSGEKGFPNSEITAAWSFRALPALTARIYPANSTRPNEALVASFDQQWHPSLVNLRDSSHGSVLGPAAYHHHHHHHTVTWIVHSATDHIYQSYTVNVCAQDGRYHTSLYGATRGSQK